MTESDKKREYDPNATIQLALDQVQLGDFEAAAAEVASTNAGAAGSVHRTAPPPLPQTPRPAATRAPKGPPARRRLVAYGAVFVVLLGLAIAAGRSFGSHFRDKMSPSPAMSSPPAPSAASPEASSHNLTLPTIEIKGP